MASLLERTFANPAGRRVLFDDERGSVTVAELEAASRELAGGLSAGGLEAGDRIVISAGSSSALAIAHVAALRLGLVAVPMNPAYQEREIRHVVEDSRPKAVVSDVSERARLVEEAAGHPMLKVGIEGSEVGIEGSEVGGPRGSAPRGSGHAAPVLDQAAPGDPALLVYTSGTTGQPKGALLSHGNLRASAEAVRTAWRWTPEDRLVLPLPLFHVHGLVVGLYGTLVAGGSVVLRSRFAAADVGECVERYRATMLFAVPTIYARLTGEAGLRALRLCVSGSAPLSAALHRAFREVTGQQILERYGMTETLMITSNPYEGARRPGTVGLPLPGVEVRLVPGGEILVRGPNVFSGYWERPAANEEAFESGWFRTGDIGDFDGEGYLSIVGRKTEVVISGGLNVYPREVEDVLRECPGVADAAVVGRPHSEWGEQVVAFVELGADNGTSTAALMAFASERLAPYKRPKVISLVAELPRNALGKVVKAKLPPAVEPDA